MTFKPTNDSPSRRPDDESQVRTREASDERVLDLSIRTDPPRQRRRPVIGIPRGLYVWS
jgi:hypothetical protein